MSEPFVLPSGLIPKLNFANSNISPKNKQIVYAKNMKLNKDCTCLIPEKDITENSTINNVLHNYFSVDGKIIGMYSINNDVIIFYNNPNTNYISILRYDESLNRAYICYDGIKYYGGEFSYFAYYNYNNELILLFCEYNETDDDYIYDRPLKYINLKTFDYYDEYGKILIYDGLLSILPEVNLSNFVNVGFIPGYGYTGWHELFISYKIDDDRWSTWYNIGIPIRLMNEVDTTLFTKNVCTVTETSSASILYKACDETNLINKTYRTVFNLDGNFKAFKIGIIISNDNVRKKVVSKEIKITTNDYEFIFNRNDFIEEEFDTNIYNNYYNVKNITNFNNRIAISNYHVFNIDEKDVDTDIRLQYVERPDTHYKGDVEDAVIFDGHTYKLTDDCIFWWLIDNMYKRGYTETDLQSNTVRLWLFKFNTFTYVDPGTGYIFVFPVQVVEGVGADEHGEPTGTPIYHDVNLYDMHINIGYYNNIRMITRLYGKDINGNDIDISFPATDGQSLYNIYASFILTPTSIDSSTLYSNMMNNNMNINNSYITYSNYYYDNSGSYSWENYKFTPVCNVTSLPRLFLMNFPYLFIGYLNTNSISNWYAYNIPNIYNNWSLDKVDKYSTIIEYYKNTFTNYEIYKFYLHYYNKYGEVSKGFFIPNKIPYITRNGTRMNNCTTINLTIGSNSYQIIVPFGKTLKEIKDNDYDDLKNYLDLSDINQDVKDLLDSYIDDSFYLSNLGDYQNGDGYDLFDFNTFLNSLNENLYVINKPLDEDKILELYIFDKIKKPKNTVGYFISRAKFEPYLQSIQSEFGNKKIYYNELNNIPATNTISNYRKQCTESIRPTGGNPICEIGYIGNYDMDVIKYNGILNKAYAGEKKYKRFGKSTALSTIFSNNTYSDNDFEALRTYRMLNIINNYYTGVNFLIKCGDYKKYSNGLVEGLVPNSGSAVPMENLCIVLNEKGVLFNYEISDTEENQDTFVYMKDNELNYYGTSEDYPSEIHGTFNNINSVLKIITFRYNTTNSINYAINDIVTSIKDRYFIKSENLINLEKPILHNADTYLLSVYSPYVSKESNNINNVILFSNVIQDEKLNVNIKFPLENYKFILGDKGSIIKLISLENLLLIHNNSTIYYLQYKNNLTSDVNIDIPEIANLIYKELYFSNKGIGNLRSLHHGISGLFGYIFFDYINKEFYKIDNELKITNISYSIKHYLQNENIVNCIFCDNMVDNTLFISLIKSDNSYINLNYNYEINSFVSIGSNNLSIINSYTKNKIYYTTDNKKIFNLSETNNNQCILDIFINDEDIFTTKYLEYITYNLYKDDDNKNEFYKFIKEVTKLKDYTIEIINDINESDKITVDKLANYDSNKAGDMYDKPYWNLGNYQVNLFRNKTNDNEEYNRICGKYFIIRFIFNDTDGLIFENVSGKLTRFVE